MAECSGSASTGASDVAGIDSDSENSDQETNEEHETTITSEASSAVVTFLDRLRTPKRSELTRKRKIFINPPRESTRKKRPSCSSNPKSVTPAQQVSE